MDGYCVVVLGQQVADLRKCIKDLDISDQTRRLKFDPKDNTVAVPVDITKMRGLPASIDDDNRATSCQLIYDYLETYLPGGVLSVKTMRLPPAKKLSIKKPEIKLKERLKSLVINKGFMWCDDMLQEIPTHWEKHGDLILLPASSFLSPVWEQLGNAFWECVTSCLSCKQVARKDVVSTDSYRTPQVNMLYGGTSWVKHTDNGIKYTYNITRCMFSSGNITEKLRVANFNCRDEIVVDLYAGIGYFTLPYLVYTGVKHLHACEWNPGAVEALHQNLKLNGVQERCTVHEGDNRKVCPQGLADRVNLGLIPSSREGWPVACRALNPVTGGILHIHHNVNTKPQSATKPLVISQAPDDVFRCEDKSALQETSGGHVTIQPLTKGNFIPHNAGVKNDDSNTETANGFHEKCDSNIVSKHFKGNTRDPERGNLNTEKSCDICVDAAVEAKRDQKHGKLLNNDVHSNATECIKSTDTTTLADHTLSTAQDIHEGSGSNDHGVDKIFDHKQKTQDLQVPNLSLNESLLNDKPKKVIIKDKSKTSKWFPWAQEVSKEIRDILEELHQHGWTTSVLHVEHVKSYAPYIDHVVLDLECRPAGNICIQ